eukprot:SAG31_NODE_25472_length_460_cov_3.108033_1_plen_71_part_01
MANDKLERRRTKLGLAEPPPITYEKDVEITPTAWLIEKKLTAIARQGLSHPTLKTSSIIRCDYANKLEALL